MAKRVIWGCLGLLIFSSAAAAQLNLQQGLGFMQMWGSYAGISEYCTAYGVDYTAETKPLKNIPDRKARSADDLSLKMAFDEGWKRGAKGYLYSPKAGQYIDVTQAAEDMTTICARSHQAFVEIGRMK